MRNKEEQGLEGLEKKNMVIDKLVWTVLSYGRRGRV